MRATVASEMNIAANIRLSVTISAGSPRTRDMAIPGMYTKTAIGGLVSTTSIYKRRPSRTRSPTVSSQLTSVFAARKCRKTMAATNRLMIESYGSSVGTPTGFPCRCMRRGPASIFMVMAASGDDAAKR